MTLYYLKCDSKLLPIKLHVAGGTGKPEGSEVKGPTSKALKDSNRFGPKALLLWSNSEHEVSPKP